MKGRNLCGLMLSVLLLLLVAGSGLAGAPQPTGSSEVASTNVSPAANAPWFREEVDTPGDTGQHVSMAIDPESGRIYVSYYDATNKNLRVAQSKAADTFSNCGPDDSWICQTIDSEGDVGKYSSIAIRGKRLMVTYHDATNRSLKVAESDTTYWHWVWDIDTVDKGLGGVPNTGLYTSLKISDSGQPFIAYYFDNPTNVDALMLAYSSPAVIGNCGYGDAAGEWWCSTIETGEGVGQHASMAIEGDWDIHIAYYEEGNGDLWYATSLGDGDCGLYGYDWACYPISGQTTDVGRYASMYVDDDSHFHIAYYDATNEKLRYAVQIDGSDGNCGLLGSAQCDEIDSMPADYHPLGVSIAEDAAGYPVIAYQADNGSLKLARPVAALDLPAGAGNCGPEDPFLTWYCETIDRHGRWPPYYRNGDFASIAVSSSGLAAIAYNGFIIPDGGNLMVSYQQPFQVFLPLVMKQP